MIVYDATKVDFRNDVKTNRIETKIHEAFQRNLGHRTSKSEIASWQNSMMYMSNILDDDEIPDNAGISIEYMLPRSSKRIDFIITGKNIDKRNSMIIVELKQWQEVQKTDQPGVVKSFVGGNIRELAHPSYQALSYAAYLEDFNDAVVKENINIKACAYLHNCVSSIDVKDAIYESDIKKAPIFTRDDSLLLLDFIKSHVRYGDEDGLMYKIDNGSIKPTKKLADSFASMLKGKQEFIMIDDQKVVFEKAIKLAISSHAKNKNVLIVHGGPGTGKNVFDALIVDEDQRVALSDIGSRDEILHWAKKENASVTELELSSQFRCNGPDGYLGWLDNYLQIKETANTE